MAKKTPAAKPAKQSIKMTPKVRSEKKRKARKGKPSVAKRYAARADKRTHWAAQNPGMFPGTIGQQAVPKPPPTPPAEEKPAEVESAAAPEAPTETTPAAAIPVDEKKVEQAQELAQAQAEARAEMEK